MLWAFSHVNVMEQWILPTRKPSHKESRRSEKGAYFSNCIVCFCWQRKDSGVGNCYRAEEQGLMQEEGIENCGFWLTSGTSEEGEGLKDEVLTGSSTVVRAVHDVPRRAM